MALTEIQIANQALSRLRHTTPLTGTLASALSDTGSLAERQVKLHYAPVVAETLRLTGVKLATRFAALALLITDDGTYPWSGQWGYQFRYPSNAASVKAVLVPGTGRRLTRETEYTISSDDTGRVIFSDFDTLNVEYVEDFTDADVYGDDLLLCRAIALRLAWAIGPALGSSDAARRELASEYALALEQAQRVDANEGEPGDEANGDFVNSRLGG